MRTIKQQNRTNVRKIVDKRTMLWYNMLRQAGKDMIVRPLAVVYC